MADVGKEDGQKHKVVTLFTYGAFPCVEGQGVQTTQAVENKEVNDLLKNGKPR